MLAHGREHLVQVVALVVNRLVLGTHSITGRQQHAVQAAQDGEWQDDFAVLVFFVGPS